MFSRLCPPLVGSLSRVWRQISVPPKTRRDSNRASPSCHRANPLCRFLESFLQAEELLKPCPLLSASPQRVGQQAVRNFQVTSETYPNLGPKSAGSKSLIHRSITQFNPE